MSATQPVASTSPDVFENDRGTPATGSEGFLPDSWTHVREGGIPPQNCSELDETTELRAEFIAGATALGLVGRQKSLQPQQYRLADVLNAGNRFTGVLMPRRSTKTTTLLAWLIGRCLNRDDYLCAYAVMTSQKKARDRFLKDVVPILERVYPTVATRPFKIGRSNGAERLTFTNGSILQFLGPNGDDYRSDAFDVIVLDESGEAEPEVGEDVLSAALPTQDTRPGSMLVKAGTAAKYRTGNLLWDELEAGRAGEPRHGILDYSGPDTLTSEELADWDFIAELLLATHPGVGRLTELESVKDSWKSLTPEKFAREYLGIFGTDGAAAGLINPEKWAKLANRGIVPQTPPARFAMAIAVHPDQTSSCIVAAWRVKGVAHIGIIDYRRGPKWLAAAALKLARKHRTGVIYDDKGVVTVETEALNRNRPRPRMLPQTGRNAVTAAGLLIKEIEAGNLVHYDQPNMNEAARLATKRKFGTTNSWLLGRAHPEDDIICMEAASLALRVYDESAKSTFKPYMAA